MCAAGGTRTLANAMWALGGSAPMTTFPGNRAGLGLALLRLTIGAPAVGHGVTLAVHGSSLVTRGLGIVLLGGGALVLLGFATSLAAVAVGLVETATVLAASGLVTAGAAAALALAGPGAWSIDARRFGRREIVIPPARREPGAQEEDTE